MATCLQSIDSMGSIGSLTEIVPNTIMSFAVNSANNRLFRLQSPMFQTVTFSTTLALSPPSTTFTVYSWDGSTATILGSVNITNPNSTFALDFPIGDYIICVRPTGPSAQAGNFVCSFTGYSQEARFSFNMFEGARLEAPLSGPPTPPRECNEALFFEILDGQLPPGLNMDSLGTITGWLPNLDCLEDSPSPAVNWYYEENDGTAWPWGREWRFQVKVWIAGMEEDAFAIDWFCVRIHNNWTFDRDNFMSQAPFTEIKEIKVVDPVVPLPKSICQPCKNFDKPAQFVPQPIAQPCAPCNASNQSTSVELIGIPLDLCQIPPNDFLPWYEANKNLDSGNPFIEKFKRDLKESAGFNILRQRAGYVEPDPISIDEREKAFVTATNYQNFLQLATVRLDINSDPESLSSLIRQWRDIENQSLPTTGYAHSGERMEIKLA